VEPWCRNKAELNDFLAFVIVYGPDAFPADTNMDMPRAIEEIKAGLERCAGELGGVACSDELIALVNKANAQIRAGHLVQGWHLLQDVKHALKA